ncbi:unnamed protein product [Phaeothamnion confervicola]
MVRTCSAGPLVGQTPLTKGWGCGAGAANEERSSPAASTSSDTDSSSDFSDGEPEPRGPAPSTASVRRDGRSEILGRSAGSASGATTAALVATPAAAAASVAAAAEAAGAGVGVAGNDDELLLSRVAVDETTGTPYISLPSEVCDACPSCADTCELSTCPSCHAKRPALAARFGGPAAAPAGTPAAVALLAARFPTRAEFSMCEVRRHRLVGSAWIVRGDTVFDVTACLEDHPGGKSSILRNCGGHNCAEDFGFHSKAAQKQWRQYRIGRLVRCPAVGGGGGAATYAAGSSCCDPCVQAAGARRADCVIS